MEGGRVDRARHLRRGKKTGCLEKEYRQPPPGFDLGGQDVIHSTRKERKIEKTTGRRAKELGEERSKNQSGQGGKLQDRKEGFVNVAEDKQSQDRPQDQGSFVPLKRKTRTLGKGECLCVSQGLDAQKIIAISCPTK